MKWKVKTIWWFWGIVLCYGILSQGGAEKYIFILLIAFYGLSVKKFHVSYKYLSVLLIPACYFITGIFCAFVNQNITKYTFKVSCFIFIPAIAAICIFNTIRVSNVKVILDCQFWAITIVSIAYGYKSLSYGNLLENQYAYILGLYVIYYYSFKRKRMFLSALLFMFLANKRIALAAAAINVLVYMLVTFFKNKKIQKQITGFIIFSSVCMCFMWIALVKSGIIFSMLSNLHIESNGRANIWNKIGPYYDFGLLYLGKGIGFVVHYLSELQISGFDNLHNDLLLIYIETGFLGFGLCILSYFFMIRKSRHFSGIYIVRRVLLVCLIGYSFMNYLTDNILIYINYWLPAYMLYLGIMFSPLDPKEIGSRC